MRQNEERVVFINDENNPLTFSSTLTLFCFKKFMAYFLSLLMKN